MTGPDDCVCCGAECLGSAHSLHSLQDSLALMTIAANVKSIQVSGLDSFTHFAPLQLVGKHSIETSFGGTTGKLQLLAISRPLQIAGDCSDGGAVGVCGSRGHHDRPAVYRRLTDASTQATCRRLWFLRYLF